MQGYYKHLTNKEIPYGTLFDNEDGDWLRPFKPATKTTVQRKDLCIIERPNRKDFTDQCEVCGGDQLMWRFTDLGNNANDDYYDCWDAAVHVFLYAIMNDPSGNFSVYATGACNCGHTEYDEGVLYNDKAGEDLEEWEKEEQEDQPWFDYNV